MKIFVNHEQHEISDNVSINELLASLGLNSSKGIAVAVNDKIISRCDWATAVIKDMDSLLLITASQGG